jgi:hypothetical protein
MATKRDTTKTATAPADAARAKELAATLDAAYAAMHRIEEAMGRELDALSNAELLAVAAICKNPALADNMGGDEVCAHVITAIGEEVFFHLDGRVS